MDSILHALGFCGCHMQTGLIPLLLAFGGCVLFPFQWVKAKFKSIFRPRWEVVRKGVDSFDSYVVDSRWRSKRSAMKRNEKLYRKYDGYTFMRKIEE